MTTLARSIALSMSETDLDRYWSLVHGHSTSCVCPLCEANYLATRAARLAGTPCMCLNEGGPETCPLHQCSLRG